MTSIVKIFRAITLLLILASLFPTAFAGQRHKAKRKRRTLRVQPVLLKLEVINPEPAKPYLSKMEAACPKFCAILITYPGGEIEPRNGVYEFTSEQRLSMTVLLKTDRVEDQYEDMSIVGNKNNNVPPTVTLVMKKSIDGNQVAVPVKLSSSGSSKDLTIYRVRVELSIPYPEEIRRKRVDGLVDYWLKYMDEESTKQGKPMRHLPNEREGLAYYFYEMIVDNQAGDYEINVDYHSKGKGVWNGTLQAPPLRLRIIEGEPLKSYLPKT
jgi:hypothetical protein